MRETRQFIVSGRVQGVGFRAATAERARRAEVAGWVRNLADGRVEVLASGDPSALDALRGWLREGPSAARVDDVRETSDRSSDTCAAPTPHPFAIR